MQMWHSPPLHRFCPSVCKLLHHISAEQIWCKSIFFVQNSCFINIKTYGSILISFAFILFYLYLFLQRQTIILPYIKVPNIHLIHERRLLHASVVFAANLIQGTLKVDFKKESRKSIECQITRLLQILTLLRIIDCKTVRIFAYSSTREQSNKRIGTRLKTERETRERR